MKKILMSVAVAIFIIIIGVFVYQYTQKEALSISGTVVYYAGDITISADAPEGYYIRTSTDRIYLEGENLNSFLGKNVNANGFLDGEVCGYDGGSCFPLLSVQEVNVIK